MKTLLKNDPILKICMKSDNSVQIPFVNKISKRGISPGYPFYTSRINSQKQSGKRLIILNLYLKFQVNHIFYNKVSCYIYAYRTDST